MHAGLILFLWVAGVASVQLASGGLLAALVSASLSLVICFARIRGVRLIRRVRVLLLAIFFLFAWFTPGEALVGAYPVLSPTREGLVLALLHAGRLLVVVCWVALLLERLPPDRLVSGLYALCRPGAVLGLSAQRLALRLLLVLRYVDDARGGRHEWKQWLLATDEPVAPVHLVRERLRALDLGVLVLVGGLLGWWMW
jgi:energy-coupling factor transporter transmembrane protein EcfT